MKTLTDNDIIAVIDGCARGSYQRHLLDGGESWSGASLIGKASRWGGRYATSRRSLLERINAALDGGWDVETQLIPVMRSDGFGQRIGIRLCRELVVCGPDCTEYSHGRYHKDEY